jgi:hypothetical protein
MHNIMGGIEQDSQIIDGLSSVLISPIKRDEHIAGSGKERVQILPARIISTSRIYYKNKNWDEDMSDISIRFYEKVFPRLYDENKRYVGDTMNSFNSIANRVPEAGKSGKCRTPEDEWPSWLQDYYNHYHCLANFWVLPMRIGRGGCGKHAGCRVNRGCNGEGDFIDRHLSRVKEFFDHNHRFACDVCGDHSGYYEKFKVLDNGKDGWENFIEKLCLEPYLTTDGTPVKLSELKPKEFCEKASELIHKRAALIAKRYKRELGNLLSDVYSPTV